MFYLGIDIIKNTHVASLMDEKGKVVLKAFSFSNTSDGVASFIEKVIPYRNALEVSMEATGHYWLSIYSYLLEHDFYIHVVNPIQTDCWRKATVTETFLKHPFLMLTNIHFHIYLYLHLFLFQYTQYHYSASIHVRTNDIQDLHSG